MSDPQRWLLPEGVHEYLPPEAEQTERHRHGLLDLYRRWGYQLIKPPLIEFSESLATGTGQDLAERTFRFSDPSSGRMVGIRPDITPQAARIDASLLKTDAPSRLCYCGEAVVSRSGSVQGRRSRLQIGVELFGSRSLEADWEVMELMLSTLDQLGLTDKCFDLGHQGLLQGLLAEAQAQGCGLDRAEQMQLLDLIQKKALHDYRIFLDSLDLSDLVKGWLALLPNAYGGADEIDAVTTQFAGAPSEVIQALDDIKQTIAHLQARFPHLTIYFDLAEMRSFHYHTGIVFAAYVPGYGRAVAKGGRYDGVGAEFGRDRPATGFSADLTALMMLSTAEAFPIERILVPADVDVAGKALVKQLRESGRNVVQALPDNTECPVGCTHQLVMTDGEWVVEALA